MKKVLFPFLLFIFVYCSLYSQINVQMIIKKPVPNQLSNWQQDPTIIQLLLINTSMNTYQGVIVSVVLKDQNGNRIAYTKDYDPKMKRFNISPNQTIPLYGPDFLSFDVIAYNESIKNIIISTNSLPEGTYSLCVKLIDAYGNEVSTGGEVCESISIFLPEPPQLISPADKSVIMNNYPQFIWTPVIGIDPTAIVDYRLKVVKLLQGQTPKAGIESNITILDKYIKTTSYQYSPGDFDLNNYNDNYGYAWQVQAVDAITKQPIAGKDGKSEIWTFYNKVEEIQNLKLISPIDNSDFSPSNGVFKFMWDASNQKKTKTAFIIKIAEIKQGQTPSVALNTNQPIFYKNDINPNLTSYTIAEELNALQNGVKYAWQMFTVSQQWGGIIDTSEIRTFTVKNDFVEKIDLVQPSDNAFIELDTTKNVYNFKWNSSKVKKSISNFILKIAHIDSGQTPALALHNNTPVFNKSDIIPQASNYMIGQNQGILANRKYVWQVTAISKWYNNKIVAISDIWTFEVKAAPVQLENVNKFLIGDYTVDIKKVTNKSSTNFSGSGEVTLWTGGPKLTFDFSGLQLINIGSSNTPLWKVIKGEIWTSVPLTSIVLDYKDPNIPQNVPANSPYIKSTATLDIKGLRLNPNRSMITGKIRFKTPLLIGTANPNIMIETSDSWYKINPTNKIDSGLTKPINPIKTTLLSPFNYTYELNQSSEFIMDKNKLLLKLKGSVTLPPNFKDRDGNKITVNFIDAPGFKFDIDIKKSQFLYYKITDNKDIMCRFDVVNLDLYTGIFKLKEGAIALHQYNIGLSNVNLTENDKTYFDTKGFYCDISRTESNPSFTNYRGYELKIKSFRLLVVNNVFSGNSGLNGDIFIPFLKQYANLNLKLSKTGITNGEINAPFINNSWINIFTDKTGSGKINVKVVGIGYFPYDNTFKMNAYFKFDNTPGKGVITDQIAVPNITIDSIGAIWVYGTNSYGWKFLDVAKTGKFNGFPITIDKIQLTGKFSYLISVAGTIVLSDDLSNPNGTPFTAKVDIPKQTSGGKDAVFENPSSGEFSTEEIPLSFGNNSSSFGATVKWFDNDPVYGKGFMSAMKLKMKNPGDYEVESKIMIGKTDNGNGFAYWFVESGVELGSPISLGYFDLGIKGFKGRIYSKMKHSGTGITSSDYVPDKNNKFGVYAKLPITSVSDGGIKYWGFMDLEIMIGSGFTSILHGELNVLSSGYGSNDAKIKGNATITVCTSPKLFDTEVNVYANFWNILCGNGQFKMHITENEWYIHFGTKEQPVQARLWCSSSGYSNYLEINPSSTTIGVGYTYDTGDQTWGEIFGCWGRAWGSIDITGILNYSPFNISASAVLAGGAKIGVFVDLEVWSGKLTLLEGEIQATLEATFPDPFCVAGSIYAHACIDPCPIVSCDICASASLKLRYKNGSFSLKSSCSD